MRNKGLVVLALAVLLAALLELMAGYAVFSLKDGQRFGLAALSEAIKARFSYQPGAQTRRDASGQEVASIFAHDDLLGYRFLSGAYTISLGQGEEAYSFRLTIDAMGNRVTSFLPVPDGAKIWVLGDSIASGWINHDETSFPFLLQARLPGYRVINRAVPGYGPAQTYLQLAHQAAGETPPAYIFLAFEDFLFDRLVGTAGWIDALRRSCTDGETAFSYPVIRSVGGNGPTVSSLAVPCHTDADNVPASRLSQAEVQSLAQQTYRAMADQTANSHLVILYLNGRYGPEVQALFADLQQAGVSICDARPQSVVEQDTFAPLDPHPGPKAQRYYAQVASTLVATGRCPLPQ
jgi:hypothetical protein